MNTKYRLHPLFVLLLATTINLNIYGQKEAGVTHIDPFWNGEMRFLKETLSSMTNPVLIDAGANEGNYSNAALNYNPNTTIYAFEPGTNIYSKCCERFAKSPNVHCFDIGLSSKVSLNRTFYTYDHVPGDAYHQLNSLHNGPNVANYIGTKPIETKINLTSLDRFCELHSIETIDFLKIDTEGEEYNILLGATNLLDQGRISIIQFEYGPYYLCSNCTLHDVYKFLSSKGYKIYFLRADYEEYLPVWDPSHEDFTYSNYIAIKQL